MLAGDRTTRVGEQIIKGLAELLMKKVKDPRVKGVTLTGILLSKDLKNAKIYFSVLGNADEAKRAKEGLDSAKGYIKREIGRKVKLKYIPEIIFEHDSTMETGNRIDALFKKIKEDDLRREDD